MDLPPLFSFELSNYFDSGCYNFIFLGDGLYSATNGHVFIYLDQLSDLACKSWRFFFFYSESFNLWILVMLNLERILVLSIPFFARKNLTERNAVQVIVLVLFCCFLLSILSFFTFKITPTKANKIGYTCQGATDSEFWEIFMSFILGFGAVIIPIMLLIILISILILKLRSLNKNTEITKHIIHNKSNKEFIAVVIGVSIVNIIFYIPFALTWSILTGFTALMSSDLSSLLTMLRRFFLLFAEISHIWNFYIFYARISVFRKECKRLLLGIKNNSDNTSVATMK